MSTPLRFGAIIATTAALSLGLSACGFSNSTSSSDDATTLSLLVPIYSDNTKGLWEDVISGFEDENPDITVNLEVQSWDDLTDVVTTEVQAGEAPDIYNGGPFTGFVADDLLYPVEDVVSADTLADFQSSFVDNASVDGVQYGLPLIASARTLFINEDLFAQAGLTEAPTTWDELLSDAEAISALGDDIYGYGMPLGSEEAQAETAIWFYGGGGGYGDADEITIDTEENLEAATFMQKMIDAGVTEPDAGSTDRTGLIDVFIQGKIGMIEALPPTVAQIASDNPDLNYSLASIPTEDGSSFTLGVADHLMAFKNDGDKQEAITKFFDYFYSTDTYVNWVETEGFLPTTISGGEAMADNADLAPFLAALPDAVFYPSTNAKWDAATAAIQSLIGEIAQGEDPADVLADIQAKVDES
ncbi:MAG: extracellular solute-binding protein [Microbacteriaceae bacterium]